jgi:transcription initiation factor IIF auxiliary subunit
MMLRHNGYFGRAVNLANALTLASLIVLAAGPSAADLASSATSIDLTNVATRVSNEMWSWTAYVVGSPAELQSIRCVVYILHPTYPNPIQTVCNTSNPRYPFGVTAEGWGTFSLRARIEFKDGSTKEVVHALTF